MSLQEVGDELGVSDQTVRRWIKSGDLPAYKPGKEYRVKGSDLEEFLKTREVGPKAESRSSSPSEEAPGEERRLLNRARPWIETMDRESTYWEHLARSGRVSPDVREAVANHRSAVMTGLDALLEGMAQEGLEWRNARHRPSRRVRRELQSAYNRWSNAWHALEDAFEEGLTSGQLEEWRRAQEEEEERSREVHERLQAGEAG